MHYVPHVQRHILPVAENHRQTHVTRQQRGPELQGCGVHYGMWGSMYTLCLREIVVAVQAVHQKIGVIEKVIAYRCTREQKWHMTGIVY